MSTLVLVDFCWVVHRNFHAYSHLGARVNGVYKPTGSLYGVVRLISQLRRKFPCGTYIFCMDTGRGDRERIDTAYKANRESTPEVWELKKDIIKFLSYVPDCRIFQGDNAEADDVIATIARAQTQASNNIVIFSADNDLLQLVHDSTPYVKVIRSLAKDAELLGEQFVRDQFGVEPSQLLLYRSVRGDSSDNISPVIERFSSKHLRTICEKYNSPHDILAETEFTYYKHEELKQQANFCKWCNNYAVMALQTVDLTEVKEPVTRQDLVDIATTYQMKSIYKFL